MKKIVLFDNKKDCCACSACVNICPMSAIDFANDEYGFRYPQINEDKCISCGLCKQVCNYQKNEYKQSRKETYAAVSMNTNLKESASGGLFASLAQTILNADGVVFGSAMIYEDSKLQVKHIKVDGLEDLIKLKGSKYIQSDMGNIYTQIKELLINNKLVLFSGTPCQVAGLKGYLRKEYTNLYTIEIICHGVPNEQFFQSYINYIENKNSIQIKEFKFRDKHDGWKLYGKIKYNDNQEAYFEPEESSYYQMFLNSYTYRENCYSCPYASDNRQGDITIGDYWCIDLVHPEYLVENGGYLDEQKGVSCLIINNEKGKELIDKYGKNIEKYSSTYEQTSKYNAQLSKPSLLKQEREIVLRIYLDKGYDDIEKWYKKRLSRIKFRRKIRAMIPRKVKDVVKKMFK